MSVEVWSLALNAKVGNPAKKAVLLGLANHAHPDGTNCYPSVRRLAIYTELSESTVRMKLAEMRDEGLIGIVREAHRYRPTEYRIDLEILAELRDPALRELEASKAPPISRPPAASAQPSGKPTSALRQTDTRDPAAGREPSLEPSLDPLKEPRGSSDQTPLALAKAAILTDLNNGKMYARKPEIFERVFEPLHSLKMDMPVDPEAANEPWILRLQHPQPKIFDAQLHAMLCQAFMGVLGGPVQVHISRALL